MPLSNIAFAPNTLAVIQDQDNPGSIVTLPSGQDAVIFGKISAMGSGITNYAVNDRIGYSNTGSTVLFIDEQQYSIISESSIKFKETIIPPP